MSIKNKIVNIVTAHPKIRDKIIKLDKVLMLLLIIISTINIIQGVFAQGPFGNLPIYVHLHSKPFDHGIIEFDIIGSFGQKYYEEKNYFTDQAGNAIVPFYIPPNSVNNGDSYHANPYSTVNALCELSSGIIFTANPFNIYVELHPCN
jgi:hypothetical protein